MYMKWWYVKLESEVICPTSSEDQKNWMCSNVTNLNHMWQIYTNFYDLEMDGLHSIKMRSFCQPKTVNAKPTNATFTPKHLYMAIDIIAIFKSQRLLTTK